MGRPVRVAEGFPHFRRCLELAKLSLSVSGQGELKPYKTCEKLDALIGRAALGLCPSSLLFAFKARKVHF